jgi:hypothetical protein
MADFLHGIFSGFLWLLGMFTVIAVAWLVEEYASIRKHRRLRPQTAKAVRKHYEQGRTQVDAALWRGQRAMHRAAAEHRSKGF